MTTSITLNELYRRQITLVGTEGFKKIRQAKVLVVGAGGLGCPLLQYLAASGIGKIGIVDFDVVSASNLQRQILFQISDIGKKKVEVAREKLTTLAPFCELETFPVHLNGSNVGTILADYDLIVDCTDNFYTKFFLHDACLVARKVLIQGSVYQFEGQLHLFDFRKEEGPCLRCLWPVEPLDGCTGTCAEVGVMGPLLGVLGSMQAMEALKVITGENHLKNGESLFVDLVGLSLDIRRFKQLADCPCCVKKEFNHKTVIQIPLPEELESYTILDVRSKVESEACLFIQNLKPSQKLIQLPLGEIAQFQPRNDLKYLVICASGIRSVNACQQLNKYNADVYSLLGGIGALAGRE